MYISQNFTEKYQNMMNNLSIAMLFLCIFLHIFVVKCSSPLAPGLYVFGDSLSDSGNNNFLPTEEKVNYKPYGVDFISGATGRFTNGKTFVDFIALMLGLPYVPPYLGLSAGEKCSITTGINYASGAAGILPETGYATGKILSFDEQINYFQGTVETDLPKIFKTKGSLSEYLSKSIFYVSIGSDDYINNYLQPANYDSSKIYSPQQFADVLLKRLQANLTKLYNLGARKFIVFNIGRLGCVPDIVYTTNPKPTTPCVEDVNNLVLLFNNMLPNMLTTLESDLLGSTFVRGDSYSMHKTSFEAGYIAAPTMCCEVSNATGLCIPQSTPCSDRDTYHFWDAFHPTQVVNSAIATDCFSGSQLCVPINVKQLAQKK